MATSTQDEGTLADALHERVSLRASMQEVSSDENLDPTRKWVGEVFVTGDAFQAFVAIIILANAIIIGFETDVASREALWNVFETTFLVIFIIELGLRLFYARLEFFTGKSAHGNIFDFFLVTAGSIDFCVTHVFHADLGQFDVFMKVCRLLRILRLFRLFKMIKQLYMLACGFVDTSMAVFWVSVLCCLLLYICGILLTRMLRDRAEEADTEQMRHFYQTHFGTIGNSMFTLFKLIADPTLADIDDIMLRTPWLMIFFIVFLIYGAFAMSSILTGVISEGMVATGNAHKEEMRFAEERKKAVFMAQLKRHFEASDVDGDGTMTREEFHSRLADMLEVLHEAGYHYSQADLQMIFDLVDFDKGGTIEVDEFLQGMTSFTANVSDLPLQFLRLQSNVFLHVNKFESTVAAKFDSVEGTLQNLDAKLNSWSLQAATAASPPKKQKNGFCL